MNEAIMIWTYIAIGKINFIGMVYLSFIAIALVVARVNKSIIDDIYNDPDTWEHHKVEINKQKAFSKAVNGFFYPKVCLLIIAIFCTYPEKSDLKYIIGGSLVINGVQAASDIEGVEKLPENLVNAMNVFLEKAVESNPIEGE